MIGFLPEHFHSENGLLKRKATEMENETIGQMATVPGVTAKTVKTQRNKLQPNENKQCKWKC